MKFLVLNAANPKPVAEINKRVCHKDIICNSLNP